jgi:acetoin utilization deacetylase AcuC-like enzyme
VWWNHQSRRRTIVKGYTATNKQANPINIGLANPNSNEVETLPTGLFYHPAFLKHDMGFSHPERPERLTAVMKFLEEKQVFKQGSIQLQKPQAIQISDLERVHPKDYINLIQNASDREARLDADTRTSKGSYNAAILAAGAGIRAWEEIQKGNLENAFALVRPPGHHANEQSARGFCLFNNISVLARYITATIPDSRVLILDIDAHHGNGSQEIHYEESDILYLGLHQDGRTLYPGYSGYIDELGVGSGKGYNVNLPLPPGASDRSFMQGLSTLFPPIVEQFQPTAILVSAGYDAHFRDYLTGLQFSADGYFKAAQLIMEVAKKHCQGRVIMFLEGGYDFQALSESIYNTLLAMNGQGTPIHEKAPVEDPRIVKYMTTLLKEAKALLKPWWKFKQ